MEGTIPPRPQSNILSHLLPAMRAPHVCKPDFPNSCSAGIYVLGGKDDSKMVSGVRAVRGAGVAGNRACIETEISAAVAVERMQACKG